MGSYKLTEDAKEDLRTRGQVLPFASDAHSYGKKQDLTPLTLVLFLKIAWAK